MLKIKSKYKRKGSGILDIAKAIVKKTSSSNLAKKVLKTATKENLIKASNSALGKSLQAGILSGAKTGAESGTVSLLKSLGIKKGSGIILE